MAWSGWDWQCAGVLGGKGGKTLSGEGVLSMLVKQSGVLSDVDRFQVELQRVLSLTRCFRCLCCL